MNIDPDVKQVPELASYEFGQFCFEELFMASSYTTNEVIVNEVVETFDADIMEPATIYSIPLPTSKIQKCRKMIRNFASFIPISKKDISKTVFTS